MPPAGFLPDWRDAEAYRALLSVERPMLAWEWLRRDEIFARAAQGSNPATDVGRPDACAFRWGLWRFEPPHLDAREARPMWRAQSFSSVLRAHAVRRSVNDADAFTSFDYLALATIIRETNLQHLLLSDGHRSLRLDVSGALLDQGPVRLHYRLHGFASLRAPLRVLDRLRRLVRTHRLDGAGDSDLVGRRDILELRAWDALQSGATHREIAEVLLDPDARLAGWRDRFPSLRSQVQRLVCAARDMGTGRFWRLLGRD